MNHLLRSIAPIPESGWELLDTEARERLTVALAARKLVDFSGPLGWEHSATDLGRTKLRFAFPKRLETLQAAAERLARIRPGG